MGVDFRLDPQDFEPFYHGYGENCSDETLTIGILRLPAIGLKVNKVEFPFYVTKVTGIVLLGNNVLSKGKQIC